MLGIDDLSVIYGIEIHKDVVRLEDVRVALVLHFCSDTQADAAVAGGMMHRNAATGTLSESCVRLMVDVSSREP